MIHKVLYSLIKDGAGPGKDNADGRYGSGYGIGQHRKDFRIPLPFGLMRLIT